MSGYGEGYGSREPGTRRRKIAGYLRAANELRQTYQQNAMQNWSATRAAEDDFERLPGAYPSAAVARNGEQEMILFPSYARRHIRNKPTAIPGTLQETPGAGRDVRDTLGSGDAEFWRQQWEQYEDDNAIVDVDVRGWIFAPHQGPLTRKARFGIGLARQMMGLPASTGRSPVGSASNSRSSSPHPIRERLEEHMERKDQELLAKEADKLARQGEAKGQMAQQGAYSEAPGRRNAGGSGGAYDDDRSSGGSPTSQEPPPPQQQLRHTSSWTEPSQMTQEQLQVANGHMMTRLKPFLANPMAETPISAFFYNDEISRQKTIRTDAAGHFNLRAALDFVPTHVRILASEKLSATREVLVSDARGVSVISDIDDTVKHSAISSGAKEVFRNVFLREFGELNVPGVREWYERLRGLGVSFHYVSNSPWQMYPALEEFFAHAGLPAGSFHLKAYTGMFQGIFEPVAERKKSTLERLMRDFPERRFILIGDSGEADLEVYTDVVMENPGRVLGVFIRDVTTTAKRAFFDSSMRPVGSDVHRSQSTTALRRHEHGANDENDPHLQAAITRSLRDMEVKTRDGDRPEHRPQLPARKTAPDLAEEEDLIDLASDDESHSSTRVRRAGQAAGNVKKQPPPPKPSKPANLSSAARVGGAFSSLSLSSSRDGTPRRSEAALGVGTKAQAQTGRDDHGAGRDAERWSSSRSGANRQQTSTSTSSAQPQQQPGYATMAAQSLSSLYNSATGGGGGQEEHDLSYGGYSDEPLSRKEEMWKRRWAQAKDIMDRKGVVLRSWRRGEDAVQASVALVERARQEASGRARRPR